MSEVFEEIIKIRSNPQKSKIITESHELRKVLLFAIRNANIEQVKKYRIYLNVNIFEW